MATNRIIEHRLRPFRHLIFQALFEDAESRLTCEGWPPGAVVFLEFDGQPSDDEDAR